ncbi:DUF998 domain-containing protein [Jiulongibacter sediminis]|uniref:DUF998 domain-containing protein n=1 Tax=Jiulongibacter sediminis TaxID=1605367 RepID=A0A0P7C6X8_9BACT|nr:DUF998 domain-containing protein [Jiulongibacter sediminis]KPM48120.1 hypothetical protein AFM12_11115 [Jiulongibacter sediminis]
MNSFDTKEHREGQEQLISFKVLRQAIGFLGLFFPFILIVGGNWIHDCPMILQSVSGYYHTDMRQVFVAVMVTISIFLFVYDGYDFTDFVLAKLATLFALGVAFFPTEIESFDPTCLVYEVPVRHELHMISAVSFFLILTYFALVQFRKSDKKLLGEQKSYRNTVYLVCGIVMLASIVLIGLYLLFEQYFPVFPWVFVLEWIALAAFGISWIVKGEFILADQP